MGRPRTFDETAVLDAAAAQFRVHGFADTSTEQLCAATGVRRSSLYNAFISKDEIFVRALEHFTATTRDRQRAVLEDEELDGGTRLERLLGLIVDEEREAAAAGHGAGCMTVHTYMARDVRAADERVQSILDRDYEERVALLEHAARAGQLDGTVRTDIPTETVALLVVTLMSGLRVTAQTGAGPERLSDIAETGLDSVLIA